MKIGFIGLGHMGAPMVQNLLKAQHKVIVYDLDVKAREALAAQGAVAATHIAELVLDCDVVITMVQTGEQVSELCLSDSGLFHHIKRGALYIDCSSIDVATSKALHSQAEKKHIAMVDAPVSGGVAAAQKGSLTFMVGGSEMDFKRSQEVLGFLGKKIIHAGAAGSGVAAKICNNMILGVSMIAVSEAFVLADKLGLAPEKLFEICTQASGQCWSLTNYCPWPNVLPEVPSSHNYQPGFTAKMMLKDLKLSQEAAEQAKADVPMGKRATELYQQFVAEGNSDLDFSGILLMLQGR